MVHRREPKGGGDVSFPDYYRKSARQERAERIEGFAFVAAIFLYVIGVGPALKFILAALARVVSLE